MATIVNTYTNEDGHEIAVYDSGLERNQTLGRIHKPAPSTLITTENSRELYRVRQAKKQQRVQAGAAKFLEATGQWDAPNDLDVIEAVAEQVMERAMDTDPKNSAQIKAADWIMENMGYSERENAAKSANPPPPGTLAASPDVLLDLVRLLESETAARVAKARAVDGTATDGEPT
jgi:hypothetical protein